jgi:hypothetical protein
MYRYFEPFKMSSSAIVSVNAKPRPESPLRLLPFGRVSIDEDFEFETCRVSALCMARTKITGSLCEKVRSSRPGHPGGFCEWHIESVVRDGFLTTVCSKTARANMLRIQAGNHQDNSLMSLLGTDFLDQALCGWFTAKELMCLMMTNHWFLQECLFIINKPYWYMHTGIGNWECRTMKASQGLAKECQAKANLGLLKGQIECVAECAKRKTVKSQPNKKAKRKPQLAGYFSKTTKSNKRK